MHHSLQYVAPVISNSENSLTVIRTIQVNKKSTKTLISTRKRTFYTYILTYLMSISILISRYFVNIVSISYWNRKSDIETSLVLTYVGLQDEMVSSQHSALCVWTHSGHNRWTARSTAPPFHFECHTCRSSAVSARLQLLNVEVAISYCGTRRRLHGNYQVSKKVPTPKTFRIFSLKLSVFSRNFAQFLPIYIHAQLQISVDLSEYLFKMKLVVRRVLVVLPFQVLNSPSRTAMNEWPPISRPQSTIRSSRLRQCLSLIASCSQAKHYSWV